MSVCGGIELIILSLVLLQKTLDELNFKVSLKKALKEEKENNIYTIETQDGKIEKVDILVENVEGIKIGFQKQKDGHYRIIPGKVSSENIKKQKKLIGQIKQRYAYNLVKEELKKRGYTIVEEKNIEKNLIKIVARRWR